jgi:DNA polymerase III delta prime subunit
MKLRFNQLPEKDIINFLNIINIKENLNLSIQQIYSIQKLYKSDIRSMINYMQTNQNMEKINKIINETNIINDDVWSSLSAHIISANNQKSINKTIEIINNISGKYNIEIKNIIKDYLNYIIRNRQEYVNDDFLKFCEVIMHLQDPNIKYIIKYTIIRLHEIFKDGK